MSLRVSGKNMNIGEALRTHVLGKLSTAAGKYFDGEPSGHVTIAPEGSGFRADCTLHLSNGGGKRRRWRRNPPEQAPRRDGICINV